MNVGRIARGLCVAVALTGGVALVGEALAPQTAEAMPKKPGQHVRAAMKRTRKLLVVAHKAVRSGKEARGAFRRAMVHQIAAQRAMARKAFGRAMAHTLRARKLAREVIKANKGEAPADLADTAEETAAAEGADADLDADCSAVDKDVPAEDKLVDGELPADGSEGED